MMRRKAAMWSASTGTIEACEGREGGVARVGKLVGTMSTCGCCSSGGTGGDCKAVWFVSPPVRDGGAAYFGCCRGWKNDRIEGCCAIVLLELSLWLPPPRRRARHCLSIVMPSLMEQPRAVGRRVICQGRPLNIQDLNIVAFQYSPAVVDIS